MSDYEDDYEDDFEEELSTPSEAPSSSVPVKATGVSSPFPDYSRPAGVLPVPQYSGKPLGAGFESYESSAGGPVFASSRREFSTPSSGASSRHSDPAQTSREASQSSRKAHSSSGGAEYPTESARATALPLSSSQQQQQQQGRPPGHAHSYPTEGTHESNSTASSLTGSQSARRTTRPPARVAPHAASSAVTSSSSGSCSSTHSDDDEYNDELQEATRKSAAKPQSASSHSAAHRLSDHNTAAMVVNPAVRDVSGKRHTSQDDSVNSTNKTKAIYQSNYTTVEELDDAPLPQHGQHYLTVDDDELSDEEEEELQSGKHEALATAALPAPTVEPPQQQQPATQVAPPSPPTPSSSSSSSYADTHTEVPPAVATPPTPAPPVLVAFVQVAPHPQGPREDKSVPPSRRSESLTSSSSASSASDRQSLSAETDTRTASYAGMRPQEAPKAPSPPPTPSTDSEDDMQEERTQLLLRIAELKSEIATWDGRIARKRALMAAAAPAVALTVSAGRGGRGRGRGRSPSSAQSPSSRSPSGQQRGRGRSLSNGPRRSPQRTNSRVPPAPTRRNVSGGRGRGAAAGGGPTVTKARLAALREKNAQLEAEYARFTGVDNSSGGGGGGGVDRASFATAGIDVPALVARADAQLQKARNRLKEVTAARRALENRDKRAAHTIEEVHRRMPSHAELQARQVNEGVYSRTSLQRTLKELRDSIDRARAGTLLMEGKCKTLAEQVEERKLSSITPKEYEALCASREAVRKVVERHRAAIAVYSAAVAQEGRGSVAGGGRPSAPQSRTTSPRKSSNVPGQPRLTPAEQQAMEDEANKAALLADQQQALQARKQELQTTIDDLWRRIEQRGEQINANHSSSGGAVEGRVSPPARSDGDSGSGATAAAAGSGVAAVRKNSLRNVLQSPAGKQGTPAQREGSYAPEGQPASTPQHNGHPTQRMSAAAERLRGAVAAARQKRSSTSPEPAAQYPEPLQQQQQQPSKALPLSTGTGQRTVRGAAPPTTSAFAALPDSPTRLHQHDHHQQRQQQRRNPWDAPSEAQEDPLDEAMARPVEQDAHGSPVEEFSQTAAPTRPVEYEEEASSTGAAAADMYLEDDGGIEAMLRKIDEDNRRIGEEVFGKAAQPESHHNNDGSGSSPAAFAQMNAQSSGAVYEESVAEDIPEEEDPAGAANGSGRSTPDWLREI